MNNFQIIGKNYKNTADVPKDDDIYYRCTDCGDIIPSVPDDNIGCKCGNIYIDKDWWRLVVVDFGKFEVLRKTW
jgi:hypothetical protein